MLGVKVPESDVRSGKCRKAVLGVNVPESDARSVCLSKSGLTFRNCSRGQNGCPVGVRCARVEEVTTAENCCPGKLQSVEPVPVLGIS